MTDWVVRRWARYGHERLYAETPGGTALGYLDLKTGRFHSDDVTNLPLLQEAVSDHLATARPALTPDGLPGPGQNAHGEMAVPALPVHPASGVSAKVGWTDLSATAAGSAAQERALAERAAQGKVRHAVARLVGAKTQERAWRIGAQGEQAVADQLGRLGPSWRILHAVPVGGHGADIDHVVIGPGGVFTVNAKNHPHKSIWVGGDTILVNGQQVPYVRNSRYEAHRAGRLLTEQAGFPVHSTGIIAIVGAHNGYTVKKQPEDGVVVVVQRKRISQFLQARPSHLTIREIDTIYNVARRSTTWR